MSFPCRLHLLRHASAAWPLPGGDDYERSLDEAGRQQARALARILRERGIAYDAVVCSGAVRARQTLAALDKASLRTEPVFDDALYHGGPQAYREALGRAGGGTILLLGHNPMIEQFAIDLAAQGEAAALQALHAGFATCALAVLRVDLSGAGYLEEMLDPEDAGAGSCREGRRPPISGLPPA